jgi:hypothetical protein
MWMEAMYVGQTGVVDHHCSPYQKALMPRERQHRVTIVWKATPHEQSTLYAFIPPPDGLMAASIEEGQLGQSR